MKSFKSICIEDSLQECRSGKGEGCMGNPEEFELHHAAQSYNYERMKELLDDGKDPNLKDGKQRTVLHVLLSDGFRGHLYEANMEECVKLVLNDNKVIKCNVNLKDSNGETPLSLAVSNGFESCAKWLVKKGADYSVRTTKYYRMHSLSSTIAKEMPNVMIEILNSGVTLDYVVKNGIDKNTTEEESKLPELLVKLDWNPVLQFSNEANEQKFKRLKYTQREMSFLYSLVDVLPNTRNMLLSHPLVSAFLHMKTNAISRNLRWIHLILGSYPIFYMLFIYFLYFDRCKFNEDANEDNVNSNSSLHNSMRLVKGKAFNIDKKDQLCEITLPISLAGYSLMAIVAVFGLVEVYVQFRVDARYLKSWRTWVIRASLVIMGLTLWPALQFNTLYDITWQYPIAALGTFFAWVMFLMQMELIPQVKIYLEMLVTITLSVLKTTVLFLPLLIGFYMGFNLMFFEIGGVMNFILMTVDVGSNEYEEMIESAKDSRAWFTIMAYIFSVAFIIVIAVVFMNFLLGISINDIQELKRNAKIMALSNKVQNMFIIDLVFPTRYNLVPEGEYRSYFSYRPDDATFELPEDIRTQLTLLLKAKYSIRKGKDSRQDTINDKTESQDSNAIQAQSDNKYFGEFTEM